MALVEVKVPDIGDFKDVEVIELLVKPGDTVKAEQSLITVESDKASMEIPSSHAGVVKELKVKLGDKVSEGSLRADAGGRGAAAPLPPPRRAPAAAAAPRRRGSPLRRPPRRRPPRGGAGRGRRARHRRLRRGRGDRGAGQARRHRQGRAEPDHGRESDKASMEIPSSHAGVVKELQGQARRQGHQGHADRRAARRRARRRGRAGCRRAGRRGRRCRPPAAAPAAARGRRATAALPRARAGARPARRCRTPRRRSARFARELGVPLDEVKGSGPKGRITQDDVQGFVKGVMAGACRPRRQKAKAPAARRGRRRLPRPAALAAGRLRQVRPGRAQGPRAHQEDQRRQPAPQLGDDPARHQPRRRRHHRARSLPRAAQQGEREVAASRSRCWPS